MHNQSGAHATPKTCFVDAEISTFTHRLHTIEQILKDVRAKPLTLADWCGQSWDENRMYLLIIRYARQTLYTFYGLNLQSYHYSKVE